MAKLFANGLENAGFSEKTVSPILFEDCFYRDGVKVVLNWSDINYSDFYISNLSIDRAELSLRPDENYLFTVETTPSTAFNNKITWSSSNEKVATVDQNGVVTAHSYGSATITAKAVGGICANCYVSVKDNSINYRIYDFFRNIINMFIRFSSLFTF
jgi:hypothetical protein